MPINMVQRWILWAMCSRWFYSPCHRSLHPDGEDAPLRLGLQLLRFQTGQDMRWPALVARTWQKPRLACRWTWKEVYVMHVLGKEKWQSWPIAAFLCCSFWVFTKGWGRSLTGLRWRLKAWAIHQVRNYRLVSGLCLTSCQKFLPPTTWYVMPSSQNLALEMRERPWRRSCGARRIPPLEGTCLHTSASFG